VVPNDARSRSVTVQEAVARAHRYRELEAALVPHQIAIASAMSRQVARNFIFSNSGTTEFVVGELTARVRTESLAKSIIPNAPAHHVRWIVYGMPSDRQYDEEDEDEDEDAEDEERPIHTDGVLRRICDRYRCLAEQLAACNLGIRDDSTLSWDFIIHGSGSLENVVTTMREMNWFYSHSNYAALMSQSLNAERAHQDMMRRIDRELYYSPRHDRQRSRAHRSSNCKEAALQQWIAVRLASGDGPISEKPPEMPPSLYEHVRVLLSKAKPAEVPRV